MLHKLFLVLQTEAGGVVETWTTLIVAAVYFLIPAIGAAPVLIYATTVVQLAKPAFIVVA